MRISEYTSHALDDKKIPHYGSESGISYSRSRRMCRYRETDLVEWLRTTLVKLNGFLHRAPIYDASNLYIIIPCNSWLHCIANHATFLRNKQRIDPSYDFGHQRRTNQTDTYLSFCKSLTSRIDTGPAPLDFNFYQCTSRPPREEDWRKSRMTKNVKKTEEKQR